MCGILCSASQSESSDSATTIKIPLLPVVITQVSGVVVIYDWSGTAEVQTIKTNRTALLHSLRN